MSALPKLKQVRQGHRLYCDKLIGQGTDKKLKYDEMKVLLASLSAREVALGKCDGDILDALTEEDQIVAEIENASTYADKIIAAKTRLELDIQHHDSKKSSDTKSTAKSDSDSATSSSNKDSKIQIKLPSIEISKYDGCLLSWSLFWDKFTVAVHSRTDLEDIQKYTYLKSYLVGDAKRAIQGISYDKDNYANAVDALKTRFGNKQLRISAHMKELQNISGVNSLNDVEGLRRMYDALEMNITNLKELEVDVTTYGSLLIAIIFDRIPDELRIKISLEFGDEEWKLDKSMELFKSELEARERSSAIGGFASKEWVDEPEDLSTTRSFHVGAVRGRGRYRGGSRGSRGTRSASHQRNFNRNENYHQNSRSSSSGRGNYNGGRNDGNRQEQPECVFCKEAHLSSRCRNITDINARYDIVNREKRCYVCLKSSHRSRDCRLEFYSCVKCQRKHNIALCDQPREAYNGVARIEYPRDGAENNDPPDVSPSEVSPSDISPPNVSPSDVSPPNVSPSDVSPTNV